ncbi:signal peptidase complex catalytic subunit sec11 [Anaeramoeba flamelloides]|uniref:Signal peptidase complex catalytic subunit SEC11 n=1 Tax=Anaeramoeba flamelloides TaxID=1746091 RepID=A0AAV7YZZ7_9EUKA|nr:signal peptidase complex catalytic subunit sec11 [Anaeramoeba flamelloides]KAJ6227361.1 signal peptidase complex catalytic subunit sec11 [Anaeramoeba flamelloides]
MKLVQKLLGMMGMSDFEPSIALRKMIQIAYLLSFALFLWNSLRIITDTEGPVVVVLSGSMRPAFHRGDILFVKNQKDPYQVGDIVVFKIPGKEIPIVHRILTSHMTDEGKQVFLTKGDNNTVADRGLYDYKNGQRWIEKKDIDGKIYANFPYLGMFTIWISEKPYYKFLVVGFVVIVTFFSNE